MKRANRPRYDHKSPITCSRHRTMQHTCWVYHSYYASTQLLTATLLHWCRPRDCTVPESAQEGISPDMMISLRAGVVTIYSTLQLRLWVYTLFPMLPSPQKCICICSCWYHADNPCKLFSSVVPNKKVWLNIRQRSYCWGLIYCATHKLMAFVTIMLSTYPAAYRDIIDSTLANHQYFNTIM